MTTIQIILLTLLSGLIMIDFMSAHLTVCNTITTGIVAGVIMGNPTLGLCFRFELLRRRFNSKLSGCFHHRCRAVWRKFGECS